MKELQSSKLDSALKGIGESLDLAVKMNLDADGLWNKKKYDQALKVYDHASKINPLNDRNAYLIKEAALIKYDQTSFKQAYVVQEGDTLESIAKRAKISAQRIKNTNGPRYPVVYQGYITKGMQLALPVDIGGPPY